MTTGALVAFIVHDGVLLGGENYEDGDRVVVVHWKGSVVGLLADAAAQVTGGDESPPHSCVRPTVMSQGG